MVSRKTAPTPPPKPAALAAARATELLGKQVEGGRALLHNPSVERLVFESWEQTTRAVLAAAFGDPSENVTRFETAAPGYPWKVGENDSFRTRFQRDELEAKIASVESSVVQLTMGLSDFAEQPLTVAADAHPYVDARKVLTILHDVFLEHGHQRWSISPSKDGQDNFARVGLDEGAARKSLRLLATKNLVKYVGADAFVITDHGISACDHPSTLDQELPVGNRSSSLSTHHLSEPPDLQALDEVNDVIESDPIREIVQRDVAELRATVRFGLAKSSLMLGGSILEAVLVDVLDRNRALAASYLKKKRFPEEASLPDLIGIAADPGLLDAPRHLLTPTAVAIAKAVTDHRDLIHPHAEARGRIRVDGTTAQAIVHLLSVVVRDLVEAKQRGDIDAYANK